MCMRIELRCIVVALGIVSMGNIPGMLKAIPMPSGTGVDKAAGLRPPAPDVRVRFLDPLARRRAIVDVRRPAWHRSTGHRSTGHRH